MTDVKLLMIPVLLMMIAMSPSTASAYECDQFYWCYKSGKSRALVNWRNKTEMSRYKALGYKCRSWGKAKCSRSSSKVKSKSQRRRTARRYHRNPSTKAAPTRVAGPAGEASSFEPYIQEAATRYNVPADLVRAVIRVESNFHPQAVSHAGAQGLMQLMPGTARQMGVADPFNPKENILGGTRFLRLLINRFKGDPKLTIAAYHAGPGIVARRGGIPYKQTERYVRKVLTHYYRYRGSNR